MFILDIFNNLLQNYKQIKIYKETIKSYNH